MGNRSPLTPMQGERKTVTVLFADVVGSTALAESLDPEVWAEIVAGMHARVSEAVQRYGGLIAQLLGDGVLVFFGAPVAHEDDPERAIRAALDLLASIREYEQELAQAGLAKRFEMRVGLNTGLVVVGNIAAGGHVEYLAIGDTVNVAARMQSAAEPGSVLIAENTARSVRHAFDLAVVGALEVKGKSEPVPAFRVLGEKAQPESKRGIIGLNSPIVGRDAEIALIRDKLHALAAGHGGILALIGEAGIGKSRLLAEVILRSPERIARIEGRCQSYQQTIPFAPINEILQRLLKMEAGDDEATRLAKMRAALPPALAPFLATFFGLPIDGDERDVVRYLEPPLLRERILAAMIEAFVHCARMGPLAIVVEDLHWADSGTLDVLERLMPATAAVPLLIVAAFRPGAQEPSAHFDEVARRDYAARYTPITLQPLDDADARALVGNLLAIEDLPETVRQLILRKAEGNPFYVEEVIRSLLDAGLVVRVANHWRATKDIVNIDLPSTLTGVIISRLDRLDEAAKRVAQTAAVLGRDFNRELLAEVLEARDREGLDALLATLAERELVIAKGDAAYHFKHILTQEAAYGSLLMSRRKVLHLRAAEALVQVHAPPANEIAHHFLEAQEPQRALPYLVEAGELALRAYSTPEAIALLSKAVEIAGAGNDTALARRAYEGLGNALTLAMDPARALETYAAMQNLAEMRRDTPMRVSALNKMSFVQSMYLGQFEQAENALNSAEHLARSCDDRAGLAEGLLMRCNVSTMKAEFEEGVKHLDGLVSMGRELNRDFETAFGLLHAANFWIYLVRFDKAWPAAQEARAFAQSRGDLMHLGENLAFAYPMSQLSFGEVSAALDSAEEGARLCLRIGDLYGGVIGSYVAGSIARWRGDLDLAMTHFERGLEAAKTMGMPFAIAMILAAMCSALVEKDVANFEATREMHEQVLQLLAHPMGAMAGGSAWADLGECALALGKLDSAQELFQKGLTESTVMKNLHRPRLLVDLARVALARGHVDDADARLRQAREYAEGHKMLWCYPMISLAEAEVNMALAGADSALECYRSAHAQATAMGMSPIARQAAHGIAQLAKSQVADEV